MTVEDRIRVFVRTSTGAAAAGPQTSTLEPLGRPPLPHAVVFRVPEIKFWPPRLCAVCLACQRWEDVLYRTDGEDAETIAVRVLTNSTGLPHVAVGVPPAPRRCS